MRTIKKKRSKKLNPTTIKALKEIDEMERNEEKYPRYDSVEDLMKDLDQKRTGVQCSGFKLLYLLSPQRQAPT